MRGECALQSGGAHLGEALREFWGGGALRLGRGAHLLPPRERSTCKEGEEGPGHQGEGRLQYSVGGGGGGGAVHEPPLVQVLQRRRDR